MSHYDTGPALRLPFVDERYHVVRHDHAARTDDVANFGHSHADQPSPWGYVQGIDFYGRGISAQDDDGCRLGLWLCDIRHAGST